MSSITNLDHLIYAVPDLHKGMEEIENLFGIKPIIGGQHSGFGSWNALVSLGPEIYLEILAPDPQQVDVQAKWLGLENLTAPKITRWAAKTEQIEKMTVHAKKEGLDLGTIFPGSRTKPNGTVLNWKLTNPTINPGDGIIPFLIDWGNSEHPETHLPKGCQLMKMEALHPAPEKIQQSLKKLNLDVEVKQGKESELIATIQTPKGIVLLR